MRASVCVRFQTPAACLRWADMTPSIRPNVPNLSEENEERPVAHDFLGVARRDLADDRRSA
jgi:hypothetical protein